MRTSLLFVVFLAALSVIVDASAEEPKALQAVSFNAIAGPTPRGEIVWSGPGSLVKQRGSEEWQIDRVPNDAFNRIIVPDSHTAIPIDLATPMPGDRYCVRDTAGVLVQCVVVQGMMPQVFMPIAMGV